MKKRNFKSNINNESHNEMLLERANEAKESLGIVNNVVLLDCNDIDTWCYRDRMEFELGDIDSLGSSIQNKGQAQPIIVVDRSKEFVAKSNINAKYVVIAGYRRWMACSKKGIKVQAVISKFSFEEAVACLMAENEKEDVSDYSKGMFFSSIIKSENITQDSLHKKLNISVTSINRYLSFARVPDEVWQAVGDISKVSSRTAAELASISKRSKRHLDAIIEISEHIKKGAGAKRVVALIDSIINKSKVNVTTPVLIKHNGKTYVKITDSTINFSKDIREHKSFPKLKDDLIMKFKAMIPAD